MVNGGLSVFLTVFVGLRQCDPFSPILFVVIMEVLNKMLMRARELELLKV